jgi:prepilin-type N-terminal cleavage/methylation domain-containing protein
MNRRWKTTGPQEDACRSARTLARALARTSARTSARRSALGFTLVELLVVVAVIGIALLVGIQGLTSTVKRQNLASASNDLTAFAQRVQIEMQRRNTVSFLLVHPWTAQGTLVELILDTNANGLPDDAVLASYTLRPELALSSTSATGQTFNAQWTSPADGTHYLECDFQGRAMITTLSAPPVTATGAQQISAPATVPLSHSDMISGSLTPQVVYTLSINPVWKPSLARTP